MRRDRGPRFPMGALFGGVAFATVVIGYFWVGTLVGVGAGLHPLKEAGRQIARVVQP